VEAARTLPARVFRRSVEHWKEQVDAAGTRVAEAERFERRGLDVTPTGDGMVRLDGSLDPETGGTVMTALRSVTAGWARHGDDSRSPAQRRADALGEICRGFLDGSWSGEAGMERPHITVVVDLDTLKGRAAASAAAGRARKRRSDATDSRGGRSDTSCGLGGRRSDTSEGTSLPAETVRRLACDASVSRVIVRGPSEPLDVGRTTRVVSPALRRALAVRDGGCAFPTCDRPVGWCDAHHVRHWADGGRTELSNLVLLCRRHHTLTHSGFGVEVVDGRVVVRRPDGSEIARGTSHADPPAAEATLPGLDRAPP
jgi:hypothetical protein